MGESKSRRSPTNLQLALPECESLIIGPASDGTLEKASAVFAHPSGRSSTSPDSCCPGEERLRRLTERIQSCRTTLSSDLCTRMRPLYSIKPSLRKRFMK
jgi:hypothetical protein